MSTSTLLNPIPKADVTPSNTISGLLAIAFPVVMICAVVGYRKYRVTVLRRQVERLNQLWQLSADKRLS